MGRRGWTCLELLVLISLLSALIGAGASLAQRDWLPLLCSGAPMAVFILLFLGVMAVAAWHERVTVRRVFVRLDRIHEEEGDPEPELLRLRALQGWVGPRRLEPFLLDRLDVEGPCRAGYLRLLGESFWPSDRAVERLRALAEEPDPLAHTARDILARWKAGNV